MYERKITARQLTEFREYLYRQEKSTFTVKKYLRDIRGFLCFLNSRPVSKENAIEWKMELERAKYAPASINSMLASIHCLFEYMGWADCKVKSVRTQKKVYASPEQELTREEYQRLVRASRGRTRLNLVIQTICATGIRVSELRYFTREAVEKGEVSVHCKNKTRVILIPRKLRRLLLEYAKKEKIRSGMIFVTRGGKPLDRSNIWAQMKSLCEKAQVNPAKVFPHNLRKLFARSFYNLEKDIAKLADILGHTNIETTRIYIMSTGTEHRRKLEKLDLVC